MRASVLEKRDAPEGSLGEPFDAPASDPSEVIRLDGVSAAYGRHVAMKEVSLSVRQNDFIGVIGPNGAGKTTILTVINGIGNIIKGKTLVLGRTVNRRNGGGLRKQIGYVAQLQEIDPLLPITVYESVLVGCFGQLGFFRKIPEKIHERAKKLLELVGLQHLSQRPLGHLSGGEKQRVAIARALLQEPEILLLDEPTASLDWQSQKEVLELIQSLHNRFNLTSLIVTHDLNTLPEVCNRIVFMKNSRLIWQGTPEQAIEGDRLSLLYGTKISVVHKDGRPYILS